MVTDMKRNRNSSAYFFLLFSLILLFAFSTLSVEAGKYHGQKMHRGQHKKQKNHKGNVTPPRRSRIPAHAPASPPISYPTESTFFDVLSFGAKGDGTCDDSKVNILLVKPYMCFVLHIYGKKKHTRKTTFEKCEGAQSTIDRHSFHPLSRKNNNGEFDWRLVVFVV